MSFWLLFSMGVNSGLVGINTTVYTFNRRLLRDVGSLVQEQNVIRLEQFDNTIWTMKRKIEDLEGRCQQSEEKYEEARRFYRDPPEIPL